MIGILGGTFDPVHYGHLRPALELLEELELEQLRLIPLAVAVHRAQPAATAQQRLAMLRAAAAEQRGFEVDPREVRRAGRSYTLETLGELRRELPDATLCLCVGGDAFNAFLTWHRPLEILELAHLVIMQRPATATPADPHLRALLQQRRCPSPRDLRRSPAGRILLQPVTQLDISATAIRALLAAGRSPRFLLPEPVLEIIEREGLYG
jgi:nicotinate-nucleotide adenylyltransferase